MSAMTETRARVLLAARSGGECEACGTEATDASHRIDRSDGGGWALTNLIHACRLCHQWWHSNPLQAYQGGWRLRSGTDPAVTVVWLRTRYGQGWWLLDEEGNYVMPDARPPTMRPEVERT
jgi:hypothetical protein